MERLKISVRKIVEFILRCGDIDSRYVDGDAMYEGSRIHRKIQKDMGSDYKKEVQLSLDTDIGEIPIRLQGRADGVITDPDGSITVDEIKATTLTIERAYEQYKYQHLGQAKCYAYMLLQSMPAPPPKITLQLTYYQIETEQLRRFSCEVTAEELSAFFSDIIIQYSAWIRFELDWKRLRDDSAKQVGFPFSYRKGQREMAVYAYRCIEQKKRLYAQAPTGIGKTLSTIFPCIKAMGEGLTEKIFYLTAKTVTRSVAEETITLMENKGLRFKSVTLRAKNKICFCDEPICTPDSCPVARGHYDRINAALLDLLQNNDRITPEIIEAYAKKHSVCPYELTLDVSQWADMVICDYNHVFDPVVYLHRFFNGEEENYVFLIDEAHNLTERVREMYTETLCKFRFQQIKKELHGRTKTAVALRRETDAVIRYMEDTEVHLPKQGYRIEREYDPVLVLLLKMFSLAAQDWLSEADNADNVAQKTILELYFSVQSFLGIIDLYDEHFTTMITQNEKGLSITSFCLDPSAIIRKKLRQAKASILFSATLTPLPYYREMLGGDEQDWMLDLPSPYPQNQLLLMANYGISTKYKDREHSYSEVAECIFVATSYKRGNYMVFFPSYLYLEQVYTRFVHMHPDIRTILQSDTMNEQERAAFLTQFSETNAETLIGFCVLGGIFSEGIDLKGNRLIGTIVVGVGLPRVSLRQELIKQYFEEKEARGYDFAYVYPGINKVLQAAGRVIRSESDFGIVLLIDSRYHTQQYRGLFPGHWRHMRFIRRTDEIGKLLAQFPYF